MRSRKQKFMWTFSFLVLSLFTVYSLFGMLGIGTTPAYAETLSKNDFYKRGKQFMLVDKKEKNGGITGNFNGEQEICSLNTEQVAELDAFFKVDTFDVDVRGENVTIAAVSGKRLTKQQLLNYLKASDQSLECHLVQHHRMFFLPVLPQLS